MKNYKMIIAYDGRKYIGFNKTKKNASKSVQGKLESILEKLYDEHIEVIGAVNTSAGVHAKQQVVNFVVDDDRVDGSELFDYFEKYLTDDIIVLSVQLEDSRFQSRYLMKDATYEYRLWKVDAPNRPLFERNYVNLMKQWVDVDRMKEAACKIEGEHDFLAFTTNRKAKKSIKEVKNINIEETRHEIVIKITANGFLLNMERYIVGTLIQVGLGQLPMSAIDRAFKSRDNDDVGHKASADALSLIEIGYVIVE